MNENKRLIWKDQSNMTVQSTNKMKPVNESENATQFISHSVPQRLHTLMHEQMRRMITEEYLKIFFNHDLAESFHQALRATCIDADLTFSSDNPNSLVLHPTKFTSEISSIATRPCNHSSFLHP